MQISKSGYLEQGRPAAGRRRARTTCRSSRAPPPPSRVHVRRGAARSRSSTRRTRRTRSRSRRTSTSTFTGGLSDIIKTTPGSPFKLYPMPAGYQAVARRLHRPARTSIRRTGPTTATMNAASRAPRRSATAPGGTACLPDPDGRRPGLDPERRHQALRDRGHAGHDRRRRQPGMRDASRTTRSRSSRRTRPSTSRCRTAPGTSTTATPREPRPRRSRSAARSTVLGSVIQADASGDLLTDVVGGEHGRRQRNRHPRPAGAEMMRRMRIGSPGSGTRSPGSR